MSPRTFRAYFAQIEKLEAHQDLRLSEIAVYPHTSDNAREDFRKTRRGTLDPTKKYDRIISLDQLKSLS